MIQRIIVLMLAHRICVQASLLFPASSVFQITSSFSAPVEIPGRKIYWDWGLQMNYNLPFNLQQFYNAPIWPGKWDRKRRQLIEGTGNHTLWNTAEKYRADAMALDVHPSDFTAGDFYYALENLLTRFGFHETCLLRSVCELARHPFSDDRQNLITEILTFVLTPSMHEAFSEAECMYRDVYEEAERKGFLRNDCGQLYSECKEDLLTSISTVMLSQ